MQGSEEENPSESVNNFEDKDIFGGKDNLNRERSDLSAISASVGSAFTDDSPILKGRFTEHSDTDFDEDSHIKPNLFLDPILNSAFSNDLLKDEGMCLWSKEMENYLAKLNRNLQVASLRNSNVNQFNFNEQKIFSQTVSLQGTPTSKSATLTLEDLDLGGAFAQHKVQGKRREPNVDLEAASQISESPRINDLLAKKQVLDAKEELLNQKELAIESKLAQLSLLQANQDKFHNSNAQLGSQHEFNTNTNFSLHNDVDLAKQTLKEAEAIKARLELVLAENEKLMERSVALDKKERDLQLKEIAIAKKHRSIDILAKTEEELERLKRAKDDLKHEKDSVDEKWSELNKTRNKIDTLENEIRRKDAEFKSERDELIRRIKQMETLDLEHQVLTSKRENLQKELENLNAQKKIFQDDKDALMEDKAKISLLERETQQRKKSYEDAYEIANKTKIEATKMLQRLESGETSMKKKLVELRHREDNLKLAEKKHIDFVAKESKLVALEENLELREEELALQKRELLLAQDELLTDFEALEELQRQLQKDSMNKSSGSHNLVEDENHRLSEEVKLLKAARQNLETTLEKISREKNELLDENQRIKIRSNELLSEIDRKSLEISNLSEELNNVRAQVQTTLQQQFASRKESEHLLEMQKASGNFSSEKKALIRKLKDKENDLIGLKSQLKHLERENEELLIKFDAFQKEKADFEIKQKRFQDVEKRLHLLAQRTTRKMKRLDETRAELNAQMAQNVQLKANNNEDVQNRLKFIEDNLKKEISELKDKLFDRKALIHELEAELKLQQKISHDDEGRFSKSKRDLETKVTKLSKKLQTQAEEDHILRQKLQSLEREKAVIEVKNAALADRMNALENRLNRNTDNLSRKLDILTFSQQKAFGERSAHQGQGKPSPPMQDPGNLDPNVFTPLMPIPYQNSNHQTEISAHRKPTDNKRVIYRSEANGTIEEKVDSPIADPHQQMNVSPISLQLTPPVPVSNFHANNNLADPRCEHDQEQTSLIGPEVYIKSPFDDDTNQAKIGVNNNTKPTVDGNVNNLRGIVEHALTRRQLLAQQIVRKEQHVPDFDATARDAEVLFSENLPTPKHQQVKSYSAVIEKVVAPTPDYHKQFKLQENELSDYQNEIAEVERLLSSVKERTARLDKLRNAPTSAAPRSTLLQKLQNFNESISRAKFRVQQYEDVITCGRKIIDAESNNSGKEILIDELQIKSRGLKDILKNCNEAYVDVEEELRVEMNRIHVDLVDHQFLNADNQRPAQPAAAEVNDAAKSMSTVASTSEMSKLSNLKRPDQIVASIFTHEDAEVNSPLQELQKSLKERAKLVGKVELEEEVDTTNTDLTAFIDSELRNRSVATGIPPDDNDQSLDYEAAPYAQESQSFNKDVNSDFPSLDFNNTDVQINLNQSKSVSPEDHPLEKMNAKRSDIITPGLPKKKNERNERTPNIDNQSPLLSEFHTVANNNYYIGNTNTNYQGPISTRFSSFGNIPDFDPIQNKRNKLTLKLQQLSVDLALVDEGDERQQLEEEIAKIHHEVKKLSTT